MMKTLTATIKKLQNGAKWNGKIYNNAIYLDGEKIQLIEAERDLLFKVSGDRVLHPELNLDVWDFTERVHSASFAERLAIVESFNLQEDFAAEVKNMQFFLARATVSHKDHDVKTIKYIARKDGVQFEYPNSPEEDYNELLRQLKEAAK